MNKEMLKKMLPHAIAVVFFLLLSMAYFPDQIKGKAIKQHDMTTYRGMSQEVNAFKKETGKTSLWTDSMFGGMPTYLINAPKTENKFVHFNKWVQLGLKNPMAHLFLYLLGFYLALLAFRVNPWLAMGGAVAYAFSSYFFIIISAGHVTKAIALGYLPAVIGGIYMAFDRHAIKGSLLMSFFLALQILTNHFQIVYYALLLVLIFGGFWLYKAIKEKALVSFVRTGLILMVGAILAVGVNATVIYMSYDYGKDSLRGKSELSNRQEVKTSGLDKDYATAWSYGKMETFTFLIPNFKGGASGSELSENSEVYKLYEQAQGKAAAKRAIKQQPTYWGAQPGTSGPVYIGAIVCFLFVLGLIIVKGPLKWWLFTGTVFSVLLAWGHNFMPLTEFFLDHFPGYNKFRTVSMILIIAEFTMPLLGIIALAKVISGQVEKKEFTKGLYWALGITGGLSLIFGLFSGLFNYAAPVDEQYIAQGADVVVDALRADRQTMLRNDAFRSLFFVLMAAALVWTAFKQKVDKKYLYIAFTVLLLLDMWPVNKRYLNSDNFISARKAKQEFNETNADKFIFQAEDERKDYRVLNLTVSTFNDASTSYHHKSIGGYHGAKLRRYQDVINNHISREINRVITPLQNQAGWEQISLALSKVPVLNMLNTKYIIINPEGAPLVNQSALGAAWFVQNFNWVNNADEEIAAIGAINPKQTAIVDVRFKEELNGFSPSIDSLGSIEMVKYEPNYLKYVSKTSSEQLAVFSEIFYNKGWQASIDGEPVSHFRANYILRAMRIPAGEHTVEFSFNPKAYHIGNRISNLSVIIMLLMVIGLVVVPVIRKK